MDIKLPRYVILLLILGLPLFLVSLITAQTNPLSIPDQGINTGNGRWTWQHPQPQGNTLNSIDCPTEKDCYAGGRLGYYDSPTNNRAFILTSQDGSKSWTGKQLTGHGINNIYCLSSEICYVASFFGQVQKTTDGGQTWNTLVTNTSENLQSIYCINSGNCIAVGDNGAIQHTNNGGQSWSTRTSNTFLELRDVTCTTPSTCLIVGGSGAYGSGDGIILISQNGGTSWQVATTQVSNILNAVACLDATTCVTVGWGGAIYVSENAGGFWREATAHVADILTDVECPSANKCFLTTNAGQIYRSSNGFIWLPDNTQNQVSLQDISCPSAKQCTAVGANGLILTTKNGGRNWFRRTQGNISSTTQEVCYGTGGCSSEYINNINDLECFDNGHCLAVGHAGLIWEGDVLDFSWTTNKINTDQNLLGISCYEDLSGKTCYVADDGGTVWKSTNNGVSWQATSTGNTYRLFDISCAARNNCFAVGENGVIIKSANGGTSWQSLNAGTNFNLFAIDCSSTSKCIAVGDDGAIVLTNNGGQTWVPPDNVPPISYYGRLAGIFCQSDNSCLAVGFDFPPNRGIVLETTNGGVDWSLASLTSIIGLNNISCTSTGICTAVGAMGSIVRSVDNGATWQDESSGTSESLEALSCLDNGSCIAVGDRGTILSAAVWPNLTVKYSFTDQPFAHGKEISGTIQIINSGTITAQNVTVSNTLPPTLQPDGPLTANWGSESITITSPIWPDLLSGLSITLTPGSSLTIRYPLTIENPQQLTQYAESQVIVNANDLPRPVEIQTQLMLAQNSSFLPIVQTAYPDDCYEPYTDDFTSNSSGWPSGDTGTTVYGYSAGEYSILHRTANQWFAITRGDLWQEDLLVQLDGYQLNNQGLWGLLFGLTNNWNNYYTFEIQPDAQRWYILGFDAANDWTLIASDTTNDILGGPEKNNLLIQGANSKMYFYINNHLVYEMSERSGYVGFTGGSFANNVHLRYDNYLFQQSPCSGSASGQSQMGEAGLKMHMINRPLGFSDKTN